MASARYPAFGRVGSFQPASEHAGAVDPGVAKAAHSPAIVLVTLPLGMEPLPALPPVALLFKRKLVI